jgi:hypothetical protein
MTEVGIIPGDWETRQIETFTCTVASGKSHVDSGFGEFSVYGSTGVIGKSKTPDYELSIFY